MKNKEKTMSVQEMKKTIKICNISSAIIIAVIVLSAFGLITGSKTDGSSTAMMCSFTTVLCSNCETTKRLKKQLAEMEKENVLASLL